MKVTELRIFVVEKKFDGRASNAGFVWKRKQAVLVEIQDEEGRKGWGECWTFDSSADALVRFIQTEIRPKVLGRLVESIHELWDEVWSSVVLTGRHGIMASGLSGVDCALWDLAGQRRGEPTAALISMGNKRDKVPVYASGGLYIRGESLEEFGDRMKGYVEQGFDCVKMKFGGLEMESDLERIEAARHAIGPNSKLILDAVYSLNRKKTETWLPHFARLGVTAVQAPFPANEWSNMTWLNKDCGIPVMVLEGECRIEIFRALLDCGAIGVMQFSPIKVGGITASLRLLELAKEYGVEVSLQVSSTWVAELIALHVGAASQEVQHVEVHQFHTLLFDLAVERCRRMESGHYTLGSASGLGIKICHERLSSCDHNLFDMRVESSC